MEARFAVVSRVLPLPSSSSAARDAVHAPLASDRQAPSNGTNQVAACVLVDLDGRVFTRAQSYHPSEPPPKKLQLSYVTSRISASSHGASAPRMRLTKAETNGR